MSKTKQKNHKQEEALRGELRKCYSRIGQLEKLVNYYKKQANMTPREIEEETEEQQLEVCDNCGKGHLELIDLVHVKFLRCDTCGYKEKIDGKKEKETNT